jgi:hypothetical protein
VSQLARVGVSAETWRSFRELAVRRGLSVTAYLGKLVQAELKRHSATALAAVPADAPPRDEALAALAEVRRSIDELDDVAGRLARSAVAHGAAWADVGSSLKLRPEAAERAYSAARRRV